MLKGHVAFAGRTFRSSAIDRRQYATRTLSTNTAINRSLRKSHVSPTPKRREWAARTDRSGRIERQEHREQWERPGPPRHSGSQRSLHERHSDPPKSLYDYSRKPGGNRATRRANNFGSAMEESRQPRNGGRIERQEHREQWGRPGPRRHSDSPRSLYERHSDSPESLYERHSDSPKSLYDYSRKPGGNRATRRANNFGSANEESRQPRNDSKIHHLPKVPQAPQARSPDPQERLVGNYTEHSHNADPVVRRYPRERDGDYREDREDPVSIPYTTPASEFLYGTSVITAALQAKKRKFYKLYMYDSENRESYGQDDALRRSALESGLAAQRVRGSWLRLMDKMSQGRPHNVRPSNCMTLNHIWEAYNQPGLHYGSFPSPTSAY